MVNPDTTDYPAIYLEPGRGSPNTGRIWCQDDVWSGDPNYAEDGKPTKYVRADLYDAPLKRKGVLISLRLYEELKDYLAMETDMTASNLLRRLRESNND